jgi:hypothetical protein
MYTCETYKYTIFDVVQDCIVMRWRVCYCSLLYTKRVYERTRQHYICTISHNAFVVGLIVGFIDRYIRGFERTRQHYICTISHNAFVVGLVVFIDTDIRACFERTRQHYICTISHNAFVVGLVGFIDIYEVLKERGNTIFTQVG